MAFSFDTAGSSVGFSYFSSLRVKRKQTQMTTLANCRIDLFLLLFLTADTKAGVARVGRPVHPCTRSIDASSSVDPFVCDHCESVCPVIDASLISWTTDEQRSPRSQCMHACFLQSCNKQGFLFSSCLLCCRLHLTILSLPPSRASTQQLGHFSHRTPAPPSLPLLPVFFYTVTLTLC
jgi:hypothetical protein